MPEISIITALYNCVGLTRQYVESLEKTLTNIDWELILIDDASSDETPAFLEELKKNPRVQCLRNETNIGYSASNNRGAIQANSDKLAFLNNDLVLSEGWLEQMLSVLEEAENAGVVGNIQFNPNTGLIDHAGVFFGLDGMPRQARKNRARVPTVPYSEWNAVTAACMIIPKPLFEECGGFDEDYRNGFEDIDLCAKVRQKGFRIYVANRSKIDHLVSVSPGRHKHNDRNSKLFQERWTHITSEWGAKE
ncbi:MAG: glycosyltransferase family 2 protein, partial [Opitutales bacterium]|nr:glycosyltransferase family 2 protein [Opitutales bacterium]